MHNWEINKINIYYINLPWTWWKVLLGRVNQTWGNGSYTGTNSAFFVTLKHGEIHLDLRKNYPLKRDNWKVKFTLFQPHTIMNQVMQNPPVMQNDFITTTTHPQIFIPFAIIIYSATDIWCLIFPGDKCAVETHIKSKWCAKHPLGPWQANSRTNRTQKNMKLSQNTIFTTRTMIYVLILISDLVWGSSRTCPEWSGKT